MHEVKGRESGQTTTVVPIMGRRASSTCHPTCRVVESEVCPKADAEVSILASVGRAMEGLLAPPREAMGGRPFSPSMVAENGGSPTTNHDAPRSSFGSVARGRGREDAGLCEGCPFVAISAANS